MKKRILVLLSVVALMVVMLATSVAPAFATWNGPCRNFDGLVSASESPGVDGKRTADGQICSHPGPHPPVTYYDNR